MNLDMTNQRAIEVLEQIPIVAQSIKVGEPIDDTSEAILKGIEALKENQ